MRAFSLKAKQMPQFLFKQMSNLKLLFSIPDSYSQISDRAHFWGLGILLLVVFSPLLFLFPLCHFTHIWVHLSLNPPKFHLAFFISFLYMHAGPPSSHHETSLLVCLFRLMISSFHLFTPPVAAFCGSYIFMI